MDIMPKQRWRDKHGEIRIMAIVEGYVVARRKGKMPFLVALRDFRKEFEPQDS